MSFKQKIIKFLTPILLPIVKLYWRIFKPETFGVKVIIENEGKFLYVRNDYGKRSITFPGGRMEKGETPEQTGIREIKEEVGLDICDLKFITKIISTEEGKRDNIYIYYAKSDTDNLVVDEFEIAEASWFTKNNLPKFGKLSQEIWEDFLRIHTN